MIRHPMAYVQMSQRVREELGEHPLVEDLKDAEQMLLEAEKQLVSAYGLWRDLMRQVSVEPNSTSASRYLKGTTWDLT